MSEDGLELTFHLRRDAVWSDGTPVTRHGSGVQLAGSDLRRARLGVGRRHRHASPASRRLTTTPSGTRSPTATPTSSWTSTTARSFPPTPGAGSRSTRGRTPTGATWCSRRSVSTRPRTRRNRRSFSKRNPRYLRERSTEDRTPGVSDRAVENAASEPASLREPSISSTASPPADAARVQAAPDVDLTVFADRSYTHVCWNLERPIFADAASAAPSRWRSTATP